MKEIKLRSCAIKRTVAAILAVVFILSASFTSCGGAESAEERDAVSFTDALGRKVSVGKQVERVAALIGSFADVWVLAGGELCAAAEDAWEDFDLALDGAVNIGGAHSPSLELLISAKPELVIASASSASNLQLRDSLEAMGINVAYFDVDNFEDYLLMLDICTDITGRKDLYEKNGLSLKTKIEEIKRSYADSDIPEDNKRILLIRASASSIKAKSSEGTVLGEMLADMGCVNIADGEGSLLEDLSIEAVIREQPHSIFVVTMGSDSDKAIESLNNMIKENPAWATLDAVREGRLHVMDKELFNLKPNRRWAEAYEILYETLTKQ